MHVSGTPHSFLSARNTGFMYVGSNKFPGVDMLHIPVLVKHVGKEQN